jgi:hypothetical protein
MTRLAFLATSLLGAVLGTGCVQRTFVITSDPPGALVYRGNVPIGTTPCDDHFVYYGKYEFTLVRDKYETLHVVEDIPAPWWEYPPLDFISENLWPCKNRDVRRLHYQLTPLHPPSQPEVLGRALDLRARGKTFGAQPAAGPLPAGPPLSSSAGPAVPQGPVLAPPTSAGPGTPATPTSAPGPTPIPTPQR